MKLMARACASGSIFFGIGLLAWVAYDATSIVNLLDINAVLDEAAVAVLTLCMGALFVLLGIRWLRASGSPSVVEAHPRLQH